MGDTTTGTVLRALPRDRVAWSRVDRTLSAALTALATDVHAPAAAGGALRAWRQLSGPLRAAQARPGYRPGPCPDLCLVAVSPADCDALGRLARALGRLLLPGAEPGPVAALDRAAGCARTTAGDLVVGLARAHGLLDLDHGPDGELLYALAGVRAAGPAVRAAHDRVTGRVATMWAAGERAGRP